MNAEAAEKSPAILNFLHALGREECCWQLTDHWTGDLCATGVASVTEPERLAYVSTWGQPTEHYFVELELPGDPYAVAERAESVPLKNAILLVVRHLKGATD